MQLVHLLIIVVVCTELATTADPKTTKRKGKGLQIHWNSPYYRKPFRPCNEYRQLNPVENVKARRYATQVFQRCGINAIVHFGTKYKFPAFAIGKLVEIACLAITMVYAPFGEYGGTIIPADFPGARVHKYAMKLLRLGTVVEDPVARHRNKTYVISNEFLMDGLSFALNCSYDGRGGYQHDLDYLKHTIKYYRFIVL